MDIFETIAALRRERQPFALATVVARRPPVSAHLGDRAIVFADGRMEGFVGGACSREIIRKQALDCLRTRHAHLVSIRPDIDADTRSDPEHVVVSMTCASEGAVDVYVEPFVQARRLVVVGATPVAEALARVGRSVDYDVVRVVDAREERDLQPQAAALGITVLPLDSLEDAVRRGGSDVAAVVASQGHYDEQALEVILKCDVPYVGLVASHKRGATVRAYLEEGGVPRIADIRNPAGLDLGARTAPEVALSILAEIVQMAPSASVRTNEPTNREPTNLEPTNPRTAVDPVCGMEVEIAEARHSAAVDGVTYYFCCPHCRAHFVKDPQSYLSPQP